MEKRGKYTDLEKSAEEERRRWQHRGDKNRGGNVGERRRR